jgi:hypothetical protein
MFVDEMSRTVNTSGAVLFFLVCFFNTTYFITDWFAVCEVLTAVLVKIHVLGG